ncbi:DUF1853 family protein [Tenacibaculum insulae]|uniref:DUF1853 family protein n=1 Tax=Tenacibaculum insulae TaxID=2029677 RepID=UPI003AB385BC
MHQKSKDIQLQYEGFLNTPFLWHGKGVFNFKPFKSSVIKTAIFSALITQKLRLGKLVERFVSFDLHQNSTIKIIAENIQIQREKLTLGELDCLLMQDKTPIHLEIVYKFYLYDSSVGNTEIEHFIGPNRKDSLVEKLTKLKEKQLPLLYSKECNAYLKELKLASEKIEQQIYFKAQLFVPFGKQNIQLNTLNQNCITGFYINQKELLKFNDCKFHIPTKHNWLVKPHTNIDWLNFKSFLPAVNQFLINKKSPLCWLKKPNGELFKIFVIWW